MKKIVIGLLVSCVLISFILLIIPERIGYGVVLWDFQIPQNNGLLVKIKQESKLRNKYIVQIDGNRIEYEKWQLHFEKRKRDAENFRESYLPFIDTFATAKRDRHAVRATADAFGSVLYTLREGEEIKIIGRTEETDTIGSTQNYWYRILTETGTAGWSYGHNLELFRASEAEKRDPYQAAADRLTSTVFYPSEYKEYIANEIYDLELFAKNYFFKVDPQKKVLTIRSKLYSGVFSYSGIEGDRRTVSFTDTPIQVNLPNSNEILIINTSLKNDYGQFFSPIPDLTKIIEAEQNRQNELFENLISYGNSFSSISSGRLTITEDKKFVWTRNRILIPDYIPSPDFTEGTVSFNLFISPDLSDSYTGGLVFRFSQGKTVYALYNADENNLELTMIPDYLVEKNTVIRQPNAPLKLYLSR